MKQERAMGAFNIIVWIRENKMEEKKNWDNMDKNLNISLSIIIIFFLAFIIPIKIKVIMSSFIYLIVIISYNWLIKNFKSLTKHI